MLPISQEEEESTQAYPCFLSPPSSLPLMHSHSLKKSTVCLTCTFQIMLLDKQFRNYGHSGSFSCYKENRNRHLLKMLKSYAKNICTVVEKYISATFLNNIILLNHIGNRPFTKNV